MNRWSVQNRWIVLVTILAGSFTRVCYAEIIRVSASPTGVDAPNTFSQSPSISADGRFVAFTSNSGNLVPNDNNNNWDIFVFDRQKNSIERVSVSATGEEANNACYTPSLSADGRYVAFQSYATNLISGGSNNQANIYVKDRQTGAVELISAPATGEPGNGYSELPTFNGDARYVVFGSKATNLIPGESSTYANTYIKDRQTGAIERVSAPQSGAFQKGGSQYTPFVTADARYVAFDSVATNLTPDKVGGALNVFVKDRETGSVELVTTPGTGGSMIALGISSDGRTILYLSGTSDVFIKDRQTGTVEKVAVNATGLQGTANDGSMSADGHLVAFSSGTYDLAPGPPYRPGIREIYVKDLLTQEIKRVSMSASGEVGDGTCITPQISANGRSVAFASKAPNLGPNDTNDANDVFVVETGFGPTPAIGDMNADSTVDVTDALIALKIAIKVYVPFNGQDIAGDLNSDGKVDIADAVLILRKAVGL